MGRFGTLLAGCALLMLLCAPLSAEGEPVDSTSSPPRACRGVVKAWRHFLVVTAAGGKLTPEDAAARKRLEISVSFSFQETPFADVVEYLSTVSGLNVVIHNNADVKAVTLTLTLKDVKLRTALDFITRQANVAWNIRDGVVLIGQKADIAAPMTTRVYDVMHLLAVPPDFEGPQVRWEIDSRDRSIIGFPVEPQQKKSGKSRQELMEELVEIVGDLLKADTWEASSFP